MNDAKLSDFTVKQLAKIYIAVEGEMNFRMKADIDIYMHFDKDDFELFLTQIRNAMEIVKTRDIIANS